MCLPQLCRQKLLKVPKFFCPKKSLLSFFLIWQKVESSDCWDIPIFAKPRRNWTCLAYRKFVHQSSDCFLCLRKVGRWQNGGGTLLPSYFFQTEVVYLIVKVQNFFYQESCSWHTWYIISNQSQVINLWYNCRTLFFLKVL